MSDHARPHPTYSFVIPVYNEQETLPELRTKVADLMGRLDGPCEAILVDDGSSDRSFEMMVEINREDPRFKIVHFSRNFGHQVAVTAGLDYTGGEAVIIMDADLQDPPEVVLELVAKWKEGYEIVHAVRERREGESWFKLATASAFYRLIGRLSRTRIPQNVGDFRLVDRKAVEAVRSMPESNRFLRGMFAWVGFRQTSVHYVRQKRFAGETKYPLRKMIRLALDGVLSFSNVPLRLAMFLGVLVAGLSFLYGLAAIILKLCGAYTVSGWTSLVVVVSFLGGVQLMVIGIVGEYLARMYDEVRHRPLYIVAETRGFEPGGRRRGAIHAVREDEPAGREES